MGRTTSKGAQFWTHHVEQYRHGELTLREYCEHHALKLSTFGRWRRRVSQRERSTRTRPGQEEEKVYWAHIRKPIGYGN